MEDLKKYSNMSAKDFEIHEPRLKDSLSKSVQKINESIDKTCRYIDALALTIAISCGAITLSIIALGIHIFLK